MPAKPGLDPAPRIPSPWEMAVTASVIAPAHSSLIVALRSFVVYVPRCCWYWLVAPVGELSTSQLWSGTREPIPIPITYRAQSLADTMKRTTRTTLKERIIVHECECLYDVG